MKSICLLVIVTILGLALFSSLSVPVAAATPAVKLVLGGSGAVPWAIGPMVPGNSGTQTVTLSNTGFQDGMVTIWVSNIVNSEGLNPEPESGDTAEPGELGNYLLINVSSSNLSTNITLPAKIADFPQNAADTKHIYINPLRAFSTITLQWQWQLPLATGNDIQGDGLSCTINYLLEELPQPSSPPFSPPEIGGGVLPVPVPTILPIPSVAPGLVPVTTPAPTLSVTLEPPVSPDGTVSVIAPPLAAAPANIEVHFLNISPLQAKPGENIFVTYEVTNSGGQSGEFTLDINIPGLLQTTQLINLEAGESQQIRLKLPPSNPGVYRAFLNGVEQNFTIGAFLPVLPAAPSGIQKFISVWLIAAILEAIIAAVLVYFIVILVKRRKYHPTKHQRRQAQLAGAIGREMNLSKKLVKMLLAFGIARGTGSTEWPNPIPRTALEYHQTLNGSGYPQKLTGDDVLLEARILAVADTIETLSSPRNDRAEMSLSRTLEEIKQTGSALYGSEVFKALVQLVERGQFKFQTQYK